MIALTRFKASHFAQTLLIPFKELWKFYYSEEVKVLNIQSDI